MSVGPGYGSRTGADGAVSGPIRQIQAPGCRLGPGTAGKPPVRVPYSDPNVRTVETGNVWAGLRNSGAQSCSIRTCNRLTRKSRNAEPQLLPPPGRRPVSSRTIPRLKPISNCGKEHWRMDLAPMKIPQTRA